MKKLVQAAILMVGALGVLAGTASAQQWVNYIGKLRLLDVRIIDVKTGMTDVRFMTEQGSLSLYATGEIARVMMEAFFRKANMTLAYFPTPCRGVTGSCGNAFAVTVDITNFP